MPELPEVETVRRGLERQTCGMCIERVEVLRARAVAYPPDPELFAIALRHCSVEQWYRRGKYLYAALRDPQGGSGGYWGVHLRMTGQFHWIPAPDRQSSEAAQGGERSPPSPSSHTRVRLWDSSGAELRFIDTRSFGQMWWVPPGKPIEAVITGLGRLGLEPFDPAFTARHLKTRLQGSKRSIKAALLDQSLVAGVGNIYADESLFAAGINPHTPSGRINLAALERLRRALVAVLEASIGAGGTTFSDFRDLAGTNGNYGGQACVYRRTGLPCPRCGSPIQRDRLGGRSTHWCHQCQR
ncbi:MAG: DNA-formamidopyrimidine glycosylase [Cyanobium sp.]